MDELKAEHLLQKAFHTDSRLLAFAVEAECETLLATVLGILQRQYQPKRSSFAWLTLKLNMSS